MITLVATATAAIVAAVGCMYAALAPHRVGNRHPVTSRRHVRRIAVSLTVWWALIALVLWLAGQALDQPATLAQCITSAAFFVAVGEAGDRLRRRWADRTAKRCKPAPALPQPPEAETPTMHP